MKIVNANEFAGWFLSEIEALKKFKYNLRIFGVNILHNSKFIESRKSIDGKIRLL